MNILKTKIIAILLFVIHFNSFGQVLSIPIVDRGGFRFTIMPVAIFTFGNGTTNGFKLGASVSLSQKIGDWILNGGVDAYSIIDLETKTFHHFCLGTTFGGFGYDDGHYGGSLILSHYYQGIPQSSGMLRVHLGDFRMAFEDDAFGVFSGAKMGLDRYRTAAIELQYRNLIAGVNVYTNDPQASNVNSDIEESWNNKKGTWFKGIQLASPLYIGVVRGDAIMRVGLSCPLGGKIGQNLWHRYVPGMATPDFRAVNKNTPFFQIGVNQSYSLY